MARVSPEDLLQIVYDEVNRAIRTSAALVFQGDLNVGPVEIRDPVSGLKLKVKNDGVDNAAVVTANALPLPVGAATEVSLQGILARLAAVGLDAAALARLDALNGRDFGTEATLGAILAKLIADPATAPRQDAIIALLGAGAREHRELNVGTPYDPATNRAVFTTAKKHLRIFTNEDVYWVDSAASDADAGTRLAAAGQRGFIRSNDRLELSLKVPVTRLDFLARAKAGPLYLTGLE